MFSTGRTPAEARLLHDTRRLTLRIYAALGSWALAVASIVAGTAGVRGAWWAAFPASVLACVLSALPRGDPLAALSGAQSSDALEALALNIGPVLAADRRRVYAALDTLIANVLAGTAEPPADRAWPGLLTALQEAWLDREWRLVAALLRMLGAHGPPGASGAVERYALGPAAGQAEADVRAAAQECVTRLAQRAEAERLATTLLRPAPPAQAHDILLRPASPGACRTSTALVMPAADPKSEAGADGVALGPTS